MRSIHAKGNVCAHRPGHHAPHGGRCPPRRFARVKVLAAAVTEAVVVDTGGKDGHPCPAHRADYERTIDVFERDPLARVCRRPPAVGSGRPGQGQELEALRRWAALSLTRT